MLRLCRKMIRFEDFVICLVSQIFSAISLMLALIRGSKRSWPKSIVKTKSRWQRLRKAMHDKGELLVDGCDELNKRRTLNY